MSPITIIIPTINRADLLKESLRDLKGTGLLKNYNLIIIDNGAQDLSFVPLDVKIIKNKENVGVARSWNQGLQHAFASDECHTALVLNDDIIFGKTPAELQNLLQAHDLRTQVLTSPEHWCAFFIGKELYEKVGPFDETFYPAYYEDTDYRNRILLSGGSLIKTPSLSPKVFNNSMTIKKDPSLNKNFEKNKEYFFQKWGPNGTLPRVTEVFMYNGELTALKARLTQTHKHVDRWIIVEGDHTFQGEAKTQAFIDDLEDPFFDPYSDRIVPSIYQFKNPKRQSAWDNEYELRNHLKSKLPIDTWCMISDLDEIPDYDMILPYIWQTLPDKRKVYTPELWDQYYHTGWVFKNKIQAGSLFFNNRNFSHLSAQHLRKNTNAEIIPNGGWHLSYFMSPEDIANKLNSFAHSEFNTPYYKDLERIKKCIKEGKDLFDREEYKLRPTSDFPDYKEPNRQTLFPSLRDLGLKHNTDKASYHHFCEFYEQNLPKDKIEGDILEVGINLGASLMMWAEWLPHCTVEGWDIEPERFKGTPFSNIEIKKVDQSSAKQVSEAAKERYSLIIDDGSHKWEHQRLTFNLLWPKCDIYIMEDFHTSVNPIYGPGTPIYDEEKEEFLLDFQGIPHEKRVFKGKEKDSWTAIFIKE